MRENAGQSTTWDNGLQIALFNNETHASISSAVTEAGQSHAQL